MRLHNYDCIVIPNDCDASNLYRIAILKGFDASNLYRIMILKGFDASNLYRIAILKGLDGSNLYRIAILNDMDPSNLYKIAILYDMEACNSISDTRYSIFDAADSNVGAQISNIVPGFQPMKPCNSPMVGTMDELQPPDKHESPLRSE